MRVLLLNAVITLMFVCTSSLQSQTIPLPEHPRPDFERSDWQNLNGSWDFQFDPEDIGTSKNWQDGAEDFEDEILVPFPWGSPLSGLEDKADIGWYKRDVRINENWKDKRVFVTIGASDWETTVWLDGFFVGMHEGGYTPFSFELTEYVRSNKEQELIIKVDDKRRSFTLYGKQGYGNARGIWQTIYLEARGQEYLEAVHFTPDIDEEHVVATAYLPENAERDLSLHFSIATPTGSITKDTIIRAGKYKINVALEIPNPELWDLDNPYLYEATVTLNKSDRVQTYFGMRKISVVNLPGTEIPYIALNDKPIYLQLALDQSYHPEGFYTFPSDQFIKEEILRSKSIGLNGIRTHIKVEVPRKLYWADKLGLLVMEDLPNSWGEPDKEMQAESEQTLRDMIQRDYNHPSIFSWVTFNETWGLFTETGKSATNKPIRKYLPKTQDWVASMYYLAKSLDQTRLVEDNSICCGRGHTETDINSWHVYLPGWKWDDYLKNLTDNTYEGSTFDFEEGYQQGKQPNINSECGNVWGYQGSTGDVDWSWDYHRMINTFRKYPKVAGWLYTEHHDVINEWNGYWRFDRSNKFTGFEELVDGMTLSDMHSDVYLSTGNEICYTVAGGSQLEIPLYLSAMTGDDYGSQLTVRSLLTIVDNKGDQTTVSLEDLKVDYTPWVQSVLEPMRIEVPDVSGVGIVSFEVKDSKGNTLHRNFINLEIISDQRVLEVAIVDVAAINYSEAKWSQKHWTVMEEKLNGTGSGYFEYNIPIRSNIELDRIDESYFLIEASAKQLFVKDQEEFDRNQDYMKGSVVAPSSNPNSYPMTDEDKFPSSINISINGQLTFSTTLEDDPADHRGALSWHHQLKDRKLREAGSYGYLVKVSITADQLKQSKAAGSLNVKLETEGEGGIAIYGKRFGRYAVNPSVVIKYEK